MSAKQHGYADVRTLPIFIDRELDDFGLDPYQFRIYARIARRAGERGAYESIKNMADGCQMSEGKVKSSLKVLIECGLITKESCIGGTSIYRLTDKTEWIKSSKDLRSKRGHSATQDVTCPPPGRNVSTHPGRNVSTTQDATCLQRYSIEDTPVEGTPIKEDPPIVPQDFLKEDGGGTDLGIDLIQEPSPKITATLPSNLESTQQSNVLSSGAIVAACENNSLSRITKPNGSEQFPWEQVDPIKGWVIEEGFLKYLSAIIKNYSQFKDLSPGRLAREAVNYANKAHFDDERKCKLLGYWQDYLSESEPAKKLDQTPNTTQAPDTTLEYALAQDEARRVQEQVIRASSKDIPHDPHTLEEIRAKLQATLAAPKVPTSRFSSSSVDLRAVEAQLKLERSSCTAIKTM